MQDHLPVASTCSRRSCSNETLNGAENAGQDEDDSSQHGDVGESQQDNADSLACGDADDGQANQNEKRDK